MPKRVIRGVVTSDKQDKTAVATVTSRKTHALYKKQYTASKKYAVHDEKNQAKQGDVIDFEEMPPVSKNKRWKLKQIVQADTEKAS